LYDVDSGDDKKRRRKNQWETYLRENNNQTEIEPIDYFYPLNMSIGGCMNSPKDTMIDGVKKYARILIREKGTK
jgi:Ni,Fe-hydrogenase III small subunit